MTKFMDKVYKHSVWILISVLLVGYFFYHTMSFQGSIGTVLLDWRTWVHVIFVVILQIEMVSGAFDIGNNTGLESPEFDVADKLNNQIITSANNEMEGFRTYIKLLNNHEKQLIREDFLFACGDKKVEELSREELRRYNKLKPVSHNIFGFNLPLYYEMSKSGQIEYKASIKKDEGKRWKQVQRAFIGIVFAAMTINVGFGWGNVGDALISVLVISSGLIATFILIYFPQVWKYRVELPKKVLRKNTLYNSYIGYKNGSHQLKELVEVKPVEVVKIEAVLETA